MNNFDLIPNEGELFAPHVPTEQRVAENQEKANTMQSLPVIDDVIEWLEKQATQALSIENIDLESSLSVEIQIKANQEVARLLRAKKGAVQALKNTYKK